uniref:TEA domain transcription factor 3 n=1 Tax=Cynoglossus semilaevis TaxID=244447 RepID=A0A3P8UI63_CYNSE
TIPSSWREHVCPAHGEEQVDSADRGLDGDPEGVWSADIEQSFQEALAIYPPCGRRKIILSDEGKMYGRNELIARYIKLRTGKTRTRKQVSSHLQVLAKRKAREFQSELKDQVSKDKALQTVANLSSAQIVTATVVKPQTQFPPPVRVRLEHTLFGPPPPPPRPAAVTTSVWQDRTIASAKLRLLEYSAFMETQRDRDTADLSCDVEDGSGAFYGVNSSYSGTENISISISTKVCSFGKQVVEKVETEYAKLDGGKFVFRIHRSPMCEYMINFIHKLKHLPEKYMMNSVLENFTILQVVSNRETHETLLCVAFVFEVSTSEHGAQHHVYRLVND